MKFEDLQFEPHSAWDGVEHATHEFDNGYGVSVITGNNVPGGWKGPHAHVGQFEIAILKDGELCYDTELTDDVLKYQSKEDVNSVLKQVEAL